MTEMASEAAPLWPHHSTIASTVSAGICREPGSHLEQQVLSLGVSINQGAAEGLAEIGQGLLPRAGEDQGTAGTGAVGWDPQAAQFGHGSLAEDETGQLRADLGVDRVVEVEAAERPFGTQERVVRPIGSHSTTPSMVPSRLAAVAASRAPTRMPTD